VALRRTGRLTSDSLTGPGSSSHGHGNLAVIADYSFLVCGWSESRAGWSESRRTGWSESRAGWSESRAGWSESRAGWSESRATVSEQPGPGLGSPGLGTEARPGVAGQRARPPRAGSAVASAGKCCTVASTASSRARPSAGPPGKAVLSLLYSQVLSLLYSQVLSLLYSTAGSFSVKDRDACR
jgi:hypothetical protein